MFEPLSVKITNKTQNIRDYLNRIINEQALDYVIYVYVCAYKYICVYTYVHCVELECKYCKSIVCCVKLYYNELFGSLKNNTDY